MHTFCQYCQQAICVFGMLKRADGSWYQLTVADCKALMGLPPQFAMPVPVTQQFRLLGNAITVEPARSLMRECKRVVLAAHGHSKRLKV